MRLAHIWQGDAWRLALVDGAKVLDLHDFLRAHPGEFPELAASGEVDALLRRGPKAMLEAERLALDERSWRDPFVLDAASCRFGPPLLHSQKILAIGLNYLDHCEEQGKDPPEQPTVFVKLSSAVVGHGAHIEWDTKLTSQVDIEAEMAFVIGTQARHVKTKDAMDYVAGYTVANDVTARDLQFGDKQWIRGKGLDTFAPIGPTLVTPAEVEDPHRLAIQSRVNGSVLQQSNTKNLIHDVPHLIAFLSEAFTLYPGDIVLTGTPAGVGVFRDPPVFVKNGDLVEIEIEKLGTLANHCRTR